MKLIVQPKLMKLSSLGLGVVLAAALPGIASAELVGPYTPDAHTLFLLHFDEPAGTSVAANVGSKGGNFYSVSMATATANPPLVTTMLGAPSFVEGPTNFNTCLTNSTVGYLFGYDFNGSGAFEADASGAIQSADRLAQTNLNIGNGGKTPFTLEAIIRPTTNSAGIPTGEIICTDTSQANAARGFQFRLTGGAVQFQAIAVSQAISGTIPTAANDPDRFIPGEWYHVALTYDGALATVYWTRLDSSRGAARVISSASLNLSNNFGVVQGPLVIGNENRGVAAEHFLGSIDEVRISSVCRAPNQMQFWSPKVSITQDPVSQNVDYNQPVTFSVGSSSVTELGYQWRFNSSDITGATASSYTIPTVAAGNAGSYDVVVTNAGGYSATSAPAVLVVGAANFLAHRYSFTADTSDSAGGAWGTNFGTATIADGKLVLDGTTGTYMELPANLFSGANASALTFEFWATFGPNDNNCRVFDFGFNNGANGFNYVAFTPHSAAGHEIRITPGDVIFQQNVAAPGNFDGLTRHVVCVIDPPNKTMAIYTNGVFEAANTNMTVNVANLRNTLSYIGRSLFTANPYLNASIDEFRIYLGALSPISIKQSTDQGPNTVLADGPAKFVLQPVSQSVPTGQRVIFSAAAVGYLPITYQWFKNGSPMPGATDATWSFPTVIGDNGASIVCYATNTVGVTTYVTNSDTVILSVFTPPTLTWVDSANGGADTFWNTSSLNWKTTGGAVVSFAQTNGVLFDNRGSGSPNVEVTEAVIPYNITVNAATEYALMSGSSTGSLNGQGGILKQGSGKLILDLTNNLTGPVTVSGGVLQVGNGGFNGSLGGAVVTNNTTISFNRSDNILNVGNAIHGSGLLTFDGYGAITLSGNSTYSGNTLLNAGILYLTSATGLGAPNTGTVVANGAQLYVTGGFDLDEPLSLNGMGDSSGALRKGGASLSVQRGPITLGSDAVINVDGGSTLVLSNTVSGAATLTAAGTGALTLTRPSTINGFVLNGPLVNVEDPRALGTAPVSIAGPGRFVIGTGLTITNSIIADAVSPGAGLGVLMVADNTNGTVTTLSGPITFNVSPANGGNFVGPATSGYLNITAPITNSVTGIVQYRAGFVRVAGGGDYTLVNLNAGTLSLGANNGLPSAATLAIALSAPATFDLNGFNQVLTGLSDNASFTALITNSAATPGTLTVTVDSVSTYGGLLAGNLALVKNGPGSLSLTNAGSTYTGDTTINGGSIQLAAPSLARSSTVRIASGGILQMDFAGTATVAGLVLNGISQPPGTYSAATSSPYLAGTGTLVVNPVATNPTDIGFSVEGNSLTLSWPADHTGWRLLQQTANLAQGISTNPADWSTVPGSSSTNRVILNIDSAKPTEFFRLVYP